MTQSIADADATVLFVCTGNAGRSQMAEVLFRQLAGAEVVAVSGGVEPWDHVHPVAAALLQEDGLDLAGRTPRHVRDFAATPLDWVVTIGDPARDGTPDLPGNPRRIHWDIGDPADADGTADSEAVFRQTKSRIAERLPALLELVRVGDSARRLHLTAGISTSVFRPNRFDPATHIPLIANAGFACIELNCNFGSEDFAWDRPEAVRELARVATDHGVAIYSVHADGARLPAPNPSRWQLAVDMAKTYADLAALLGAQVVVIHAGLADGVSPCAAKGILRHTLAELERHALPLPCRYAWENLRDGMLPAEHLAMLNELNPSAFGLVLDTGHANLRGNRDEYFTLAGGRLCDLHLNDNDGQTDLHQIPGQGTIKWDGFPDALAATGYTGPLMLEIAAPNRQHELPTVLEEARRAVELLR